MCTWDIERGIEAICALDVKRPLGRGLIWAHRPSGLGA